MEPDNICCNTCTPAYDMPSGHSGLREIPNIVVRPMRFPSLEYKMDYSSMPNFKSFSGPYKNYNPPGDRTPAVGEKIWGDVPYLPSYLDPMYHTKEQNAEKGDNLYFRGPFYKGVSETHSEYVNKGALPPRKYYEYVRHYEEPGMKYDRSVTYSDYQPPLPMMPQDKTPCLKEDSPKPWYDPGDKESKNPHAKEHEIKTRQPEVVYVDEEAERDFSTEHNDNYICYQKSKTGTKIKDPDYPPEEIFLKNLREGHQKCPHPDPSADLCDGSCKVRKNCPGATSKTASWLLYPKNYSFQNNVLLIPCKCRYDDSQTLCKCNNPF